MAQLNVPVLCLCLSLTPCIESRGVKTRGIFIPEELSSFLSLIYSNIPMITAGQDSRIGAGLRIGPNADYQVLLELGPQIMTNPLPTQPSDSLSKRQVKEPGNTNTRSYPIIAKSEESRESLNKNYSRTTKAKSKTKKDPITRSNMLVNWLSSIAKQMDRELRRTNQTLPMSANKGREKFDDLENRIVKDKPPKLGS